MNITITKEDFYRAVPAAKEPKGRIFELLENDFTEMAEQISRELLGEAGSAACEEASETYSPTLLYFVKQLVVLQVFLEKMRSLDLVLTSTGFGVVSTQDTAPASKMRVDALEGELRKKVRRTQSCVLGRLFTVKGWNKSIQRQEAVRTLFWDFNMLRRYAGISDPKPEDWDNNVPEMLAADAILKKHIGEKYMAALTDEVTSGKVSDKNYSIVICCQMFIGAHIAKNTRLKEEVYRQMINKMEAAIEDYPLYAESDAYRLNHFKPYENREDDTAFHFVG